MTQHTEIPTIADRARILNTRQTAALFGMSVQHFRRLYRTGKVPPGIRIGERKLGWQLGVATDFLAAKNMDAA